MPLYQITNKEDGSGRLVIAKSQAEAMRHVASTTFEITVPSPIESARLAAEGVTIEEAGVNSDPSIAGQQSLAIDAQQ